MPAPPEPAPVPRSGFDWLAFLGGAFGPWTILPVFLRLWKPPYGLRWFLGFLAVALVAGAVHGLRRRNWAFALGVLAGVAFVAVAVAIKLAL